MSPKSREFPRYKVVDLRDLKGTLEGIRNPVQLATFSRGGCGFYCVDKILNFNPPRRVFCVFSLSKVLKDNTRVQGNLVYAREIKADDRSVMFYGIEFIKPHRLTVDPIVLELERLFNQGTIQMAEHT